ncbi:Oidioi.mRNA.OKI2018_I69.chr2.g6658.t1.cds [Oikopleura dioica]|uniref:Oidioi.mRNA.OKI2018_I69.chr2.g6658.t1.cds n=1 Tax=Oikopleura dioica TaxID=34765 RepID=A0ABN7T9U8_OIKDI|nr:Oidioi.mRNA.OKI2018_I69.chr2.g6658.t1.cds [Oikopleura dioica]
MEFNKVGNIPVELVLESSEQLFIENTIINNAPPPTRCTDINTYNQNLTDNGFLFEIFGENSALINIKEIRKGRGLDYDWDDPMYGGELYMTPNKGFGASDDIKGDIIRLECKHGAASATGQLYTGAQCVCDGNSTCSITPNNPDWTCVDQEVAPIPLWMGGKFNFVKGVESGYVVLKARLGQLMDMDSWDYNRFDTTNHADWKDPNYWKGNDTYTPPFTLFVFCPFDVSLGGPSNKEGAMTFPDFYPGESSNDGMLWSFLSRDGTRYFKNPKLITDEVTGNVTMKFPSVYFKGYIDRSSDEAQQGPIIFDPNMQVEEDYTCEIGVIPGHHPDHLVKLAENYPVFSDDFQAMEKYLRQPQTWEDQK